MFKIECRLYQLIDEKIYEGDKRPWNSIDVQSVVNGMLYGYFRNIDGKVQISNKIFGERIYNFIFRILHKILSCEGFFGIKFSFYKEFTK